MNPHHVPVACPPTPTPIILSVAPSVREDGQVALLDDWVPHRAVPKLMCLIEETTLQTRLGLTFKTEYEGKNFGAGSDAHHKCIHTSAGCICRVYGRHWRSLE